MWLYAILLAGLHFGVCILSGALGWNWQTVVVSVASILAITIGNKKFEMPLAASLLTVGPFFLIYTTASLIVRDVPPVVHPIWIFGLLVTAVTFLLVRFNVRALVSVPLLTLLVLINGLILWPNIFVSYTTHDPARYRNIIHSKIVNSSERILPVQDFGGKVVVFDIWHSACGSCFKKFPELQQLYNEYSNDTTVKIISLNMPLDKDGGLRPAKYTEKYSFDKLYFLNAAEYEKVSIQGAPLVLILDKKGNCRYAGQLNSGWNIFTGNTRRIINKLKQEQ